MSSENDVVKNIVLDVGGCNVRVGFATDKAPRFVLPSVVGHEVDSAGKIVANGKVFVGHDALSETAGRVKWKYCFSRGVVLNWDDFDLLIEYVLSKLGVKARNCRVLYICPSFLTRIALRNLLTTFVEKFKFNEVSFVDAMHCALLSTEKKTGVVCCAGADLSLTAGYYDGFCVDKSTVRMNLGGSDVSQHLACLLSKQFDVWKLQPMVVDEIKESLCYVPADFPKEMKKCKTSNLFKATYRIKKKKKKAILVELNEERVQAPWILFKNESTLGLVEMLEHTLRNYMRQIFDRRTNIFQSVLLFGGSSNFKGIVGHIEKNLKKKFPKYKVKVTKLSTHAAWRGGAKAALNGSFDHMFLNRDEYNPSTVSSYLKDFFPVRLTDDMVIDVPVKTFNLDTNAVEKKFWRNERDIQNIGQIARTFENKIEGMVKSSEQMEDEYLDYIEQLEGANEEKMKEVISQKMSLEVEKRKFREDMKNKDKNMDELKKKLTSSKKDLQKYKKTMQIKHQQFRQVISNQDDEIAVLRKDNEKLKKLIGKLNTKVTDGEDRVRHLQEKCTRLEGQFAEKKKDLDFEFQSMKLQIEQEYDEKVRLVENKLKVMKKKLKKFESQKRNKKNDFTAKVRDSDDAGMTYLKRKAEKLRIMNEKMAKENESLKKRVKTLELYSKKKKKKKKKI